MEMEENANLSTSALMKDDAAKKCAPAKNKFRPGKAIINFWIDAMAFLTFLTCTVSGAALMRISHGEYGTEAGLLNNELFWGLPSNEWGHLHNLIGWISVALVVIHFTMHWRWIARVGSGALQPGRADGKKQKQETDI